MREQTTLFCHVGRAKPRPVATVSHDAADYEAQLAAHELVERAALVAGGNALERVQFSRETVEIVEEAPAPKAKKGKG